MKTAIVGGGAAGFFSAINLKKMMPDMQVTIIEAACRVLRKVEVSGGGRCNCTNTFRDVTDLSQVYPRGHRLLKRLFNVFDYNDAYLWFEAHGVKLTTQADQCVFPQSQDAHTIINCFLNEAHRLGVELLTGHRIASLEELSEYDFIVITAGGSPRSDSLQWLHHEVVTPVPSLFTFSIADKQLQALMGTVAEDATAFIPGTKLRSHGPLLVTHWGMSGPCILRLSSYAARLLAETCYRQPLCINWASQTEAAARHELEQLAMNFQQRSLSSLRPFGLPARLWQYLCQKCLGESAGKRWQELGKKDQNRLVNQLICDTYQTAGRAAFKDEFVTCGGIALSAVNASTLESKSRPGLYFAGEVLDIDGITGGFNFQAAWTTAYVVARSIAQKIQ